MISRQSIRFVLLSALLTVSSLARGESVSLNIGAKRYVTLPDHAANVQIDKGGVVAVDRGETKAVLVFSGKASGSAKVVVTLDNGSTIEYDVDVGGKGRSGGADVNAIAARLKAINGLSVETRASRIYIKGVVTTRLDKQTIANLKAENPGVIVDGTEKEVYETNTVVRTINRVLAENDIANLQAHAYGQLIVLEGSPKDEQQQALALRIAKTIYPGIEDSISKTSNGAPSISIEVMFVEAQKRDDKSFGISGIQDSFGGKGGDVKLGQGVASAGLKPFGGVEPKGKASLLWQVGPLNAFLKLIQTKTASRVLSNPKLVARSGKEATFHSGGTFYLEATKAAEDKLIAELVPINYGIELRILPKIDAIGQIDSQIHTSITDVGTIIGSNPSVTRSGVETAVTIKNGQSILLSGLVRKTDTKTVERVPFLADIPIVGELFKSRNLKNEETELLVLVTMRRVAGSDDRSGAASQLFEQAGDDVEFSIFD